MTTPRTTRKTISPAIGVLILLAVAAGAEAQPPQPNGSQQSPYGFNTRFNPSMAIIIVVLISAFFFMGFFSIYIRQCSGQSRSVRGGPQAGRAGRSRRAARGLDPAVIETFPIFEYSEVKNLKLGKGALECAVCLSEFDDDETLRLLPKCSHAFHPDCIDMWLSSHTTCPVCRTNLVPEEESAAAETPEPEPEAEDDNRREVVIAIDDSQPSLPPAPPADQLPPASLLPLGQNRPPRSKSVRRPKWAGKFPRSHSTGHSLVQPGENMERFTLRLPEHVRRELVKGKLNRTTSCVFPSEVALTDGSVRRGQRAASTAAGASEGSSRGGRIFGRSDRDSKSDRWIFSMTPPFISRTLSVRSPSKKAAPFDCLGGAMAGGDSEEPPTAHRSNTPVFTVEARQ